MVSKRSFGSVGRRNHPDPSRMSGARAAAAARPTGDGTGNRRVSLGAGRQQRGPDGHHRCRRPPTTGPSHPAPTLVHAAGTDRSAAGAEGCIRPDGDDPHPPLPGVPRAHVAGHGPDHHPGAGDGRAPAGRGPLAPRPVPARRADDDASTTCAGSDGLVEEVVKTLNLFLAHRTFAEHMGGSPRRAILFEGPPGNGQDLHGQGHGRRGRRALPLRVVVGLPVDVLRADQPQDPVLLQGAAHATPGARAAPSASSRRSTPSAAPAAGSGTAPRRRRRRGGQRAADPAPVLRPAPGLDAPARACSSTPSTPGSRPRRHLRKPQHVPANILVIGATNRAADLDPALVRPGRFDRTIYFDLPSRSGRREIIDYYLGKKAHDAELDDPARRDTLAAMTFGLLPGDDRAPARRGAGLGAAPRARPALVGRHPAGQDDRGDRPGPARRVHRGRAADHRHPRGRPRHGGLAGGQGPQARGPVHRQAQGRARPARPLRGGGAVHQDRSRRCEALIQIAFGGMVAEELFFGEASTGVAGDLQAATLTACQMVGRLGMGTHPDLRRPPSSTRPAASSPRSCPPTTGGPRSRTSSERAKASVTRMLDEHRNVVEALRDALLERDELVGDEILDVIRSSQPSPPAGPAPRHQPVGRGERDRPPLTCRPAGRERFEAKSAVGRGPFLAPGGASRVWAGEELSRSAEPIVTAVRIPGMERSVHSRTGGGGA